MIRPDFREIFEYITSNSAFYSINTNGTLITPEIARLMKSRGRKWIAMYGATAEVHDHITRTPGSFDAFMRGCSLLKEAGADFLIQVIPMRDNYHQFKDMIKKAQSLTPLWRVGASWLFLSASGDPGKNEEIKNQRLSPREILETETPDFFYLEKLGMEEDCHSDINKKCDDLFGTCLVKRNDFHVDPYGRMSFCRFVVDSSLRCDLTEKSFSECWENFIPSLKNRINRGEEFLNNCGSCELREDCSWCPVYANLEHGRYSAKIDHLCDIAREKNKFKMEWIKNHRRYFTIEGITIQVDSDLPITDKTFHHKFKPFRAEKPGEDIIKIRHRFFIPRLNGWDPGKKVIHYSPWTIFRKDNSWIYLSSTEEQEKPNQIFVFNDDHTSGNLYTAGGGYVFKRGNINSLTHCRSDQLFLTRVLADRQGFIVHSSGVILKKRGLLFVGHSDAGKSTMVKMLKDRAEILCDDRVIVRRWPEGFRIHGTWSHGEVPLVSSGSAPLQGIFFLEKSKKNQIIPLNNRSRALKKIISCLVRSLVTVDWWEKVLTNVQKLVNEVPCYRLKFDKSGRIVELLDNLNHSNIIEKRANV